MRDHRWGKRSPRLNHVETLAVGSDVVAPQGRAGEPKDARVERERAAWAGRAQPATRRRSPPPTSSAGRPGPAGSCPAAHEEQFLAARMPRRTQAAVDGHLLRRAGARIRPDVDSLSPGHVRTRTPATGRPGRSRGWTRAAAFGTGPARGWRASKCHDRHVAAVGDHGQLPAIRREGRRRGIARRQHLAAGPCRRRVAPQATTVRP